MNQNPGMNTPRLDERLRGEIAASSHADDLGAQESFLS